MTLTMLGEASEKAGEKQQAIDRYSEAHAIWKALSDQSKEAEMKTRIARLKDQ